jgi:catechol 2,3-dioxygenase-like lactoylglutathione lyase family enzyme
MRVLHVNPILNVSDIAAAIGWFARLGWTVGFGWRKDQTDPHLAGRVRERHLRRARDLPLPRRAGRPWQRIEHRDLGPGGDQTSDKGVWRSIFVDDVDDVDAVDAVHDRCVNAGIEITYPPTNEPWGVREMHIRHPDGHVFRIGTRSF